MTGLYEYEAASSIGSTEEGPAGDFLRSSEDEEELEVKTGRGISFAPVSASLSSRGNKKSSNSSGGGGGKTLAASSGSPSSNSRSPLAAASVSSGGGSSSSAGGRLTRGGKGRGGDDWFDESGGVEICFGIKLSMVFLMICAYAIPCFFLIGYQAVPLHSALQEQMYLSAHRSAMRSILDATLGMQEERRDSSIFLANLPNSTQAITTYAALVNLRVRINKHLSDLLRTMQEDSDAERRSLIIHQTQKAMIELATKRKRVDIRVATGPEVRADLLILVDKVYSFLLHLGADPRASTLENRIMVFMLLRRVQNSVGLMRAIGSGIISRDGFDLDNLAEMKAMKSAVDRDLIMIESSGRQEAISGINSWINSADAIRYFQLANILIQPATSSSSSRNNVSRVEVWAKNITLEVWVGTANRFIGLMHRADLTVLDSLSNGDVLETIALAEGMKMMCAVLCCFIVAYFVIVLSQREQQTLVKSLANITRLQNSVRRFVPRNQLKTIGLRSILQVSPGLHVEVAQTMLFSDIRNFSHLAEGMSSSELFDWMQLYMSRMSSVTHNCRGYISTFVADALLAVFPQPRNGVSAAIQMQVATGQLEIELNAINSEKCVDIGVGIHFGIVAQGIYGDASRLACAMVGVDVNLASQLQDLTEKFGTKILCSEPVVSQIDDSIFEFRCVGSVNVKASRVPIKVYDLYQCDNIALKEYKAATKSLFEKAVLQEEADPLSALSSFQKIAGFAHSIYMVDDAANLRCDQADAVSSGDDEDGSSKRRRRRRGNSNQEKDEDDDVFGLFAPSSSSSSSSSSSDDNSEEDENSSPKFDLEKFMKKQQQHQEEEKKEKTEEEQEVDASNLAGGEDDYNNELYALLHGGTPAEERNKKHKKKKKEKNKKKHFARDDHQEENENDFPLKKKKFNLSNNNNAAGETPLYAYSKKNPHPNAFVFNGGANQLSVETNSGGAGEEQEKQSSSSSSSSFTKEEQSILQASEQEYEKSLKLRNESLQLAKEVDSSWKEKVRDSKNEEFWDENSGEHGLDSFDRLHIRKLQKEQRIQERQEKQRRKQQQQEEEESQQQIKSALKKKSSYDKNKNSNNHDNTPTVGSSPLDGGLQQQQQQQGGGGGGGAEGVEQLISVNASSSKNNGNNLNNYHNIYRTEEYLQEQSKQRNVVDQEEGKN